MYPFNLSKNMFITYTTIVFWYADMYRRVVVERMKLIVSALIESPRTYNDLKELLGGVKRNMVMYLLTRLVDEQGVNINSSKKQVYSYKNKTFVIEFWLPESEKERMANFDFDSITHDCYQQKKRNTIKGLVERGYSVENIASTIGCSTKAVKHHLSILGLTVKSEKQLVVDGIVLPDIRDIDRYFLYNQNLPNK